MAETEKIRSIELDEDEHVALIQRSDRDHVVSTSFGPRGVRLLLGPGSEWALLVLAKLRGLELPEERENAYAALPARQRGEEVRSEVR